MYREQSKLIPYDGDIRERLRYLLGELHNICEENGLVYNLYGETFLGAVKYGDIIPWDDGVDVSMPRRDYEKFIEIVNKRYNDRFEMYAYPRKNYVYPSGKFCDKSTLLIENNMRNRYCRFGLAVDIFPFDGYPEMPIDWTQARFEELAWLKHKRCETVYSIVPSKTWWKKPYVMVRFLQWMPAVTRGYKYYLEKEIQESVKYSFDDHEYVSCAVSYGEKGRVLKQDYLDRVLYRLGDKKLYGMRKYDKYLAQLYGDYMTPPPLQEQRSSRHFKLYRINSTKQAGKESSRENKINGFEFLPNRGKTDYERR